MKLLSTIVALALSIRVDSFAAMEPAEGPVEEPVVANLEASVDAPIQGGFEAPVDEPIEAPVDLGPQCVDGYLEVTCPDPQLSVDYCTGVTCSPDQYCCHETTYGLCMDREPCVDLCEGVRCRIAGHSCCPLTGLCAETC